MIRIITILKITPVSESWAEGLTFMMPTTSLWGGFRFQRQRGNYDGNWAIGYTALDSTDDLVFVANNGGAQVNNILRLTKAGNVSTVGTFTASNFSGTSSGTNTGDQTNIGGYSTYLNTRYDGGSYANPQQYFGQSIGLRVAMTGAWSVWSDTLWINGYSGGDVLQMCALHTLRNGTPRMAISVQASNQSSYGTFYEFITAYNIASQSVSYASSAGSVAWSNITGRPGWLSSASYIQDLSDANSWANSGFYQNGGCGSNWPSCTWYNALHIRHSNQGNYHGFQLAMSYYDNNLWFRSFQGSGTFQSWAYAITNQNIGSQSVSSASTVTHYASRGDSTWYNVVWASGNPSYMYSCDAVQIRSSDGSLRVNMIYDNQNTGYYLDLNGYSYCYSMESATSMTASDWYARGGWFRNNSVNTGLYNQEVANHWYASSAGQWNIGGTNNSWCSIAFRPQGHQSQVRGSVYADTGNNIGFLNCNGSWNLRVNADGNIYTDLNYGVGIVSVYSSTRLQGVWSMGDAYKIAVDGTNAGNLYGLAWSHPNAGGQAGYLSNHGLIHMMYGTAFTTISDTIWCRGDITAYSDARVKENVEVIDNALERVQAIRGVTYTRTDIIDTEKRHAGVIAQEVLEVLPEVITQNKDNGHYSVSYGNMVGLLIEAIKEQQGQIEDLKKQIEYLVENK